MTVDESMRVFATILGIIVSMATIWGLIVNPFKNAIKRNDETMRSLRDTIKELAYELKDSQKDRENIHKQLDKHEARIGKSEDDIIVNNERIAALFKERK
ncbi:hypothetical protein [Streptococcus pluranimalium]|uniref:hypothetical protein n=1 Tax=Streptococcus pluranimalium TaxID=82348 RepID=UPI003F68C808